MSFVRLSHRATGGVPALGVSAALRLSAKGKVYLQLFLGADVLKANKLKIGDKVVVEAGCDEHDGQLRLGKDALGRKVQRYAKSETGTVSFQAWRAFTIKEARPQACATRVSRGIDEPDRLIVDLPPAWFKAVSAVAGASTTAPGPALKRDVSAAVFGPNGNGGRR
ncbi:MAG TPA: hypothetical protein PKA30_16230 [Accumulibacter sp.]|uniref:hypothetical protein n=1 Tax=Accumulibacter sp. TaxID=2053492 RepID=UPI002CD53596|nr:hypothetical protein [Accumulibacter sp.]HMV07077.1 hypothetical protein [Accumulibacter sp.]